MKSRRRRWAKARRTMRRLLWSESVPARSGVRILTGAKVERLIALGEHWQMVEGQEYPVRRPKQGHCPDGLCGLKEVSR